MPEVRQDYCGAAGEQMNEHLLRALEPIESQGTLLYEYVADHAYALTRLLEVPVTLLPAITCVRACLEGAATACWLLEKDIECRERVSRSILYRTMQINEEKKFLGVLSEESAIVRADQRIRELAELAKLLGIPEKLNSDGSRAKISPPTKTDLIKYYLDAEIYFRIFSSAAHGHTNAILQLGFTASDSANPTVFEKNLDPRLAESLLVIALESVARCAWSLSRYFGGDSENLVQVLEEAYRNFDI